MTKMQAKTAVIKVGGDVLLDDAERDGLATNVASLIEQGWQVVLLHGGGPQTNRLQQKHGLVANKVGGRRITSEADLLVVKQAIAGEVNVELTSALQRAGVNAFGCHGASGQLIQAVKRPPRVMSGAGDKPIDFGEVGDVTRVNGKLLTGLLGLGVTPVIATLGVSDKGRVFNINADTTVVQIARVLKADLLLLTTQVGAVFEDLEQPGSRIKTVTPDSAKQLIDDGIIQGGMIPKVEEAISLLDDGVGAIAIVSGREPGAFLSVANDEGRYGTIIHK
ncbi:acetylglutamate kinase [Pleionea mediterranea]|uniref:Acetylglutamate kinase n=1 Tax=Pleionea mediterranea TaxID=523701 RepID=A0A316F7F3_9GAMM|nr:acetylglutamate kinase [Pleionea mediterranea]PWK41912.1 N-acetylglutamate kinase [Pleionea mediterranea]